MNSPNVNEALDFKAVAILTGLCMLWGFNAVTIKVSNEGIAPVFCAGVRSFIAVMALVIWMRVKKVPLFPAKLLDGVVVGALFGTEFACLYASLLYTTGSSAWILLYSTPFFHALGAHFFLKGDRLTVYKSTGLILAFIGVIVLLSKNFGSPSWTGLVGDLLAFSAAAPMGVDHHFYKATSGGIRLLSPYTLLSDPFFHSDSFSDQLFFKGNPHQSSERCDYSVCDIPGGHCGFCKLSSLVLSGP